MSIRKTPLVAFEYYHVYNRGNSKQPIYTNDFEYKRFQNLLYIANGTKHFEMREIKTAAMLDFNRGDPLVAIGAYCLMPNHFHMLFYLKEPEGLVHLMRSIMTSYTMYFPTSKGK